ncbi:flavin monoamine oxidase family protein [Shewanella khirikhana]|uniref:Tryptophan 2-monooxygenase n=1 Tax=Shewanella khirikhana TaxID=1965282 RepID=A0ABN5TYU2_9GAMM|nr:NAD(P)/FAD-dependent oxidoreductase [Shewanella khirikhana]AZQ12401.1 Putrescine oxidase [Shewanella khirikhana]
MRRMSYSKITDLIRRLHDVTDTAKRTGIPVKEVLEQDKAWRQQAAADHKLARERRTFLKGLGAGIGAGLTAGAMAPTAFAAPASNNGEKTGQSQAKIAVIGAGPGGMRTAHRLKQFGMTCTLYEGSDRIGGRMYSDRSYFSDNRVVEWGGELISTEHTALRNLAHQLNLELVDVGKNTLGEEEVYLIGDELYTEHDLLDEWVGGLYELMKREQQRAPWQPFYNNHNQAHIELDNITAQDWLEGNGYSSGHWVHKLLMTDLIAEYGRVDDNSALNLIYLLGWSTRNSGGLPLAGTDERFKIKTGNDSVIHGMAAELDDGQILMGKKLVAIRGEAMGPYSLHFEDGSSDDCERLVLAMPYHLIKNIDIDPRIWDSFAPAKQRSLLEMQAADNGKLQLEFASRDYAQTRQIHGREVSMSAVSYSGPDSFISTWEGDTTSPSDKGIIVNYTGGYWGEHLSGRLYHGPAHSSDVNRLLAEYDKIWPGISAQYTGKALVSNWWQNPWSRGAFVSPVVGTMTGFWGAQFSREGNILFAGEACDVDYWSYMNGAISSGERIARELAQE